MSPERAETGDPMDPKDARLLEELRQAAAHFDPPPAATIEAARASLTWRTIDAELAALAFDSAVDAAAVAVRGGGSRLLTFAAPGLDIEVEVVPVGRMRRLTGQLVPPQPARIDIRHADGITPVEADDLGRFAADAVSAGPVSLRCRLGDAPAVVTEWIPV